VKTDSQLSTASGKAVRAVQVGAGKSANPLAIKIEVFYRLSPSLLEKE